jgi:hypothetical protein
MGMVVIIEIGVMVFLKHGGLSLFQFAVGGKHSHRTFSLELAPADHRWAQL